MTEIYILVAFVLGSLVYHFASGGKTPLKPLERVKQLWVNSPLGGSDNNTDTKDVDQALAELGKLPDLFARRVERESVEREQQERRDKAVNHIV